MKAVVIFAEGGPSYGVVGTTEAAHGLGVPAGVLGIADSHTGVTGISNSGTGISATSTTGTGLAATSQTLVWPRGDMVQSPTEVEVRYVE